MIAYPQMKITNLEFIPVSVPYTHREVSSLVNRDGVTDIIVKATSDDGLIGWGESSSGADVKSVQAALEAAQRIPNLFDQRLAKLQQLVR